MRRNVRTSTGDWRSDANARARDALKNAIGPTISGSNGVVFRIVLELMTPSQCDIRLLA
jgi:hypothetical protein